MRECHGDLHLGNMALINNQVTLFDCIEFNPQLRWIDTISEVAFVAMDLQARGYPDYCWRFINHYLEISADYAGVKLLRYYFIYRALVRAKVEALRVEQQDRDVKTCSSQLKAAVDYIELAGLWAGSHRAGMIIMHGLSGSGKSTIATKLVEALGAIQVRSDVVRKHLFDLDAAAQTDSALDQGIYTEDATELTYRRLATNRANDHRCRLYGYPGRNLPAAITPPANARDANRYCPAKGLLSTARHPCQSCASASSSAKMIRQKRTWKCSSNNC